MADDYGRFVADARSIKSEVWPLDDDITAKKIEAWLQVLVGVPVRTATGERVSAVVLYNIEGVRYGYLPAFLKHQKINKPTDSHIPPPPLAITDNTEPSQNNSGIIPESPQNNSGTSPASRARGGVEWSGVGKERSGVDGTPPQTAVDVSEWPDLSDKLEVPHHRESVGVFLARFGATKRNTWAQRLSAWLGGMDAPYAVPVSVLATGLGEYEGDGQPAHVWSFVDRVNGRFGKRRDSAPVQSTPGYTANGSRIL